MLRHLWAAVLAATLMLGGAAWGVDYTWDGSVWDNTRDVGDDIDSDVGPLGFITDGTGTNMDTAEPVGSITVDGNSIYIGDSVGGGATTGTVKFSTGTIDFETGHELNIKGDSSLVHTGTSEINTAGGAIINDNADNFTNTGTLVINQAAFGVVGGMTNAGGTLTVTQGQIEGDVKNSGIINANVLNAFTSGTVSNDSSGIIYATSNSAIMSDIENDGTIYVGVADAFGGDVTNDGDIRASGATIGNIFSQSALTNTGNVFVNATAAVGVLGDVGSGTVILDDAGGVFGDLGTNTGSATLHTGSATQITAAVNNGTNDILIGTTETLEKGTESNSITFDEAVTAGTITVKGTGGTVTFTNGKTVSADIVAGSGNTLELGLDDLAAGKTADISGATLKSAADDLNSTNITTGLTSKLATDANSIIDIVSGTTHGTAGDTVNFGTLRELQTGTVNTFLGGVTVTGEIAVGEGSSPTTATTVTFNEGVTATNITYNGLVNNITFNEKVTVSASGLTVGSGETATFGENAEIINADSVVNNGSVVLHVGADRVALLENIDNSGGIVAFDGDTEIDGDVTIDGGTLETRKAQSYTGNVKVDGGNLVIGTDLAATLYELTKTTFKGTVEADEVSFGGTPGGGAATVVFENSLKIATATDFVIEAGKTVAFQADGNMIDSSGGLQFDGGTLSMGAELSADNAESIFESVNAGGSATGLIVFDTTSGTEVGYAVKNTLAGVDTETGAVTSIGDGTTAFDMAGAVILGSNSGATASRLDIDGSVKAGSMQFGEILGVDNSPITVSFNGSIELTGTTVFAVADSAGKTIDLKNGAEFVSGTTMTNGAGNKVTIDAEGNLSNLLTGITSNSGTLSLYNAETVDDNIAIAGPGDFETHKTQTYNGSVTVADGRIVLGSETEIDSNDDLLTFKGAVVADTIEFGSAIPSPSTVTFENSVTIGGAADLVIGDGKTVKFQTANASMTGSTGGLTVDDGVLSLGADLNSANTSSLFSSIDGASTGILAFHKNGDDSEVGYEVANTVDTLIAETRDITKFAEDFSTAGALILGSDVASVVPVDALEFAGEVSAEKMTFGTSYSPDLVTFRDQITLTGTGADDKVINVVSDKTVDMADNSKFGTDTSLVNSGNVKANVANANLDNVLAGVTNNGVMWLYGATTITPAITIKGTGVYETRDAEVYEDALTVADGTIVLGSNDATADVNENTLTFEGAVSANKMEFGDEKSPAKVVFQDSLTLAAANPLEILDGKTVMFDTNGTLGADTTFINNGVVQLANNNNNLADIFDGEDSGTTGVFQFVQGSTDGSTVVASDIAYTGALAIETMEMTEFSGDNSTTGALVFGSNTTTIAATPELVFSGDIKAGTMAFGAIGADDNSPDKVTFKKKLEITGAALNIGATKTVKFDSGASLADDTQYKNDGVVELANDLDNLDGFFDAENGGVSSGVIQFVKGTGAADKVVAGSFSYGGDNAIETMDMTEFSGDNSTDGALVFGSNTTTIAATPELVFSGDISADSMAFGAVGGNDNSPAKVTFKGVMGITGTNPMNIGTGKTVKFDSEATLVTGTQYKNDGVLELANNIASLDSFFDAETGGAAAGVIRFVQGSVGGGTTVGGGFSYDGNNTIETGEMALFTSYVDANGALVFGSNSAVIGTQPVELVFQSTVSAATMTFGSDANSPDVISFGDDMSVVDSTGLVVGDGKTVNFGITAPGGYTGGGIYGLIDVKGGTANFHVDVDDATSGLSLNVANSGGAHIYADVAGALTMGTGMLNIDGAAASFTDTNTDAFTLGTTATTRDSLIWLENGGTADFSGRSGFTVENSGAISGDGTFILGSGKTLTVNGAIESYGNGLNITAGTTDIAGTVIFGVNGLPGDDERFAAVTLSGDVNFKSGSTLRLSGAAIDYVNRIYDEAGYDPDSSSNTVPEPLYGEALLSAGNLNYADSGWDTEYGVGVFDNVDYYYTLNGADNEIVFGGRETIRGSDHDKLTSYWKRREGVDIGGLITRNGANVLADTASDLAKLGSPYSTQESQILYLSGKWGQSGLLGGFGTRSAFNYEFGQAYTKPVNIAKDNIRYVFDELAKFEPTWDLADNAGYQGASVGSGRGYAASSFDCPPGGRNNGFFAGGIGLWQDLDAKDNGAGGYKYNSGGVLAGYSHRFGGLTASAAFAYNGGDYKDTLAYANDSDIENYTFLLNFKYKHQSGFFAGLGGGYAYSDYDLKGLTDKVVDIDAGTVARGWDSAKYHGNTWLADLELGYELRPTSCFAIIPSVGLSYVNASARDFTSRWRSTDAVYNSVNRIRDLDGHSLQLPVDLTLALDIPLGAESKFRVMANGGYAYEFHNKGVDGTLSWGGIAGSPSVSIRDREPGRNTWNVGGGLQYTHGGFDFSAKYDYYSRSKLDAHRLVGTIGIKF